MKTRKMVSNYPPGLSPLLRLTPLTIAELPPHPDLAKDLPKLKEGQESNQPDLLPFIVTLLNDGLSLLSKSELSSNFKHTTTKKADGSNADVDILTQSISKSTISSQVPWYNGNSALDQPSSRHPSKIETSSSTNNKDKIKDNRLSVPDAEQPRSRSGSVASTSKPKIRRTKPNDIQDEHWFTRRSIHNAISHKLQPGTASWEQFIFGLLHEHSKHEQDFTPNLFDAHPVVNWDGQVRKLAEEGGLRREGWFDVNIGVWEMCHDLPGILGPRCFGVCVVGGRVMPEQDMLEAGSAEGGAGGSSNTASEHPSTRRWEQGEQQKFVVVTVPVVLTKVKASFYGSLRNFKEGKDDKQKRGVVQGLYAAVETCTLRNKPNSGGGARAEEEVDWIMSTASDARGNLPMLMQKLALPGQLPKDVSYFMKWIRSVDEEEVEKALAGFE